MSKTCSPSGMQSDTEVLKRDRGEIQPFSLAGRRGRQLPTSMVSVCLICETDIESMPWDPVRTSVAGMYTCAVCWKGPCDSDGLCAGDTLGGRREFWRPPLGRDAPWM